MDKSPYRSEEEEAKGRQKDAVRFARERIVAEGLAAPQVLDALDAAAGEEMDRAIDFAVAAELPAVATLFRDVYALGEPEPEPVRTRIDRVLARD
jgi:pyruvate dehydrogenase E1 component alpha subunit